MTTLADTREEKALADARAEARERVELARIVYIVEKLRDYPMIGILASGRFYGYVGPKREYFESAFLARVIDAVVKGGVPRKLCATYSYRLMQGGKECGTLTVPADPTCCFFFDKPLWTREGGFITHTIRVAGYDLVPMEEGVQ